MSHLAYLGVLAFVLLGTAWLEVVLRTRVYSRWRRLLLTLAPVVVVFSAWDLYAIAAGHWTFDPRLTTGVLLPGGLPLDEVLFFVVVPLAAVLTLEAVRSVTRWEVGDESPGACVGGVRVDRGDRSTRAHDGTGADGTRADGDDGDDGGRPGGAGRSRDVDGLDDGGRGGGGNRSDGGESGR